MASEMFDIAGRTAFVAGASSGLGRHFATVLARAGAHVVLAGRREALLETAAQEIRETGGSCATVALDVTDFASIESAGHALGTADIVVNSAGIAGDGASLDQSEAAWDSVLDTNLKGMFLLSQAAASNWRAQARAGIIINIASILGLRQAGRVLPYAVSKAGVIQLTKTLALELARYRIRVNALAPGYFATDLNARFWESDAGKAMINRVPQRRLGELADLDGPLLLLASDASRFMTGSILTVDGGHLVSGL